MVRVSCWFQKKVMHGSFVLTFQIVRNRLRIEALGLDSRHQQRDCEDNSGEQHVAGVQSRFYMNQARQVVEVPAQCDSESAERSGIPAEGSFRILYVELRWYNNTGF